MCDASVADSLIAGMFHVKGTHQPHIPMILFVLEGIAEGMSFIHSNNIVHGQ